MMMGADISITRLFFQALLPATLGNLVGGGLLIGAVYWYVFDSMDTIIHFRERIQYGRKRSAIGSESPAFTPDNEQRFSKRYLNQRFWRQTSTPVASQQGGT
jgi:hypothetical protein